MSTAGATGPARGASKQIVDTGIVEAFEKWRARQTAAKRQQNEQPAANPVYHPVECALDGGQIGGWELTGPIGLSEDESHGQAPRP